MSSPYVREAWRHKRTLIVEVFCRKMDFTINPLNQGYQLRVENLVDFYPVNGRYCILQTGERGDWENWRDLRRIMLKALPSAKANSHEDMVDSMVYAMQPIHDVDHGMYYGHKHFIWFYKLVDRIIGKFK